MPTCLRGVSVVIVGLFSSFVVSFFARRGCSRPQGKGSLIVGESEVHRPLEKRDGDETEGRGPPGRKLGTVYDIQGFCKDSEDCL